MADLQYNRGTTFNITVTYNPPVGSPAGEYVMFTVKTEVDNDITDTANDILTPKNVAMVDNACVIPLAPADIDMTHEDGNYVWDAKILDVDGNIYLATSGKFILDVTATNRLGV